MTLSAVDLGLMTLIVTAILGLLGHLLTGVGLWLKYRDEDKEGNDTIE